MTYAELQTLVLSEAHRPDLTAEVAGFIRRAEGRIRRELNAYELTATLAEVDRDADGVYDLPSTVDLLRVVYDEDGEALENVGTSQIRSIASGAAVKYYTVIGNQIEFRGVPGTDAEFTIRYFGHPAALSSPTDTNDLLADHEDLYVEGALFYLYKHTQDLELAKAALEIFNDVLTKLNEQHSRKIGGASISPASYNLGNLPRRGGY